MPTASEQQKTDWLLMGLQCAAQLTASRFLHADNESHNLLQTNARSVELHPLGLHSHAVPEVCLALEGKPAMAITDYCYEFIHPTAALFAPGEAHSEGALSKRSSYVLFWMSITGSRAICLISRYLPRLGWDCPWRRTFASSATGRLEKLFDESGRLRAEKFDYFRAELVSVMSELHRQEVYGVGGDAPQKDAASQTQMLESVRDYLDRHYDQPVSLADVASLTRMTPNYVNSLFRKWEGRGIHQYLIALRMENAMRLCLEADLPVNEIARAVGYDDPLYFSKAFKKYHNVTPSQACGDDS